MPVRLVCVRKKKEYKERCVVSAKNVKNSNQTTNTNTNTTLT
jgi:predicted transcriptional regulator